jgi:hypothetical protein
LRQFAGVGLGVACEADYASGASLLFFLSYQMFVMIALEYKIAGSERYKQEKWGTVDYYALLLTRASMLFGPELHTKCLDFIHKGGLAEQYASSEAQLNESFAKFDGDPLKLAESYQEQGVASPFSDRGGTRTTAWQQRGIEWVISWPTDYDAERLGSALCAVFQVVCASLHTSELTFATERIHVHLTTLNSGPGFRQLPNNDVLEFSINLAYANDLSLEEAMWALFNVLKTASAMPADSFEDEFKERFRSDLVHRCGAYVSPAKAFRQFYGKNAFEQLHSDDQDAIAMPTNVVASRSARADDTSVHPVYDEAEMIQQIENRYARITRLFPFTLRQLSDAPEFQRVVNTLRGAGWKDWHLLLAVASIRMNYLANNSLDQNRTGMAVFHNGEAERDPLTPEQLFDERSLRLSLQMSQMSTLRNLGFTVKHMTPNLSGVDRLLRRFKYWDLDDVAHQDPFLTQDTD